jgi:hypothetical protein
VVTREGPSLFVDPGAKAGYCVVGSDGSVALATHLPDLVPTAGYAEAVFEAQHSASSMYRNGRRVRIARKSQSTLSFTAGRLFERFQAERKYRIMPDDWRALLWAGARRLPKAVVLARLEVEFGGLVVGIPKTHRADVLEAVGMSQGWSLLTQRQKEKFRVE